MKVRPKLVDAINHLADCVENGHLLASMGGEDLLNAAAAKIQELEKQKDGTMITMDDVATVQFPDNGHNVTDHAKLAHLCEAGTSLMAAVAILLLDIPRLRETRPQLVRAHDDMAVALENI